VKAFQLLRKGCLGQRRRIDDLNRFHVVDEQVEAGLPAAACRAHSVSRPHRPDQRDPPADDRTAEADIDNEDQPTVLIDPELRLVQPASGMAHRSDQEA
jgi:hypothetical protein